MINTSKSKNKHILKSHSDESDFAIMLENLVPKGRDFATLSMLAMKQLIVQCSSTKKL